MKSNIYSNFKAGDEERCWNWKLFFFWDVVIGGELTLVPFSKSSCGVGLFRESSCEWSGQCWQACTLLFLSVPIQTQTFALN